MIVLLDAAGSRRLAAEELDAALASLREPRPETVWLHLDPEDSSDDALGRFGLHEVALRSLREGPERPRVEEYDDHLYTSLLWVPTAGAGLVAARGSGALAVGNLPPPEELRIFMSERWLISRGRLSDGALDELIELVRRQVLCRGRGPSHILYYLAEWVIDTIFPVLDDVVDRVDRLEDLALEQDGQDFRHRLLGLKRDMVNLRRGVVAMRDVLQRLAGRGLAFVDEGSMVYFRDVHDDALSVLEQLDTQHDILASTLDLHLSAVSNRLNKVMQSLTIVATVFMPLTFVTGFFGQNFTQLPFGSDLWFVVMLALTVGGAAGMLFYFRRKRWM